MTRSMKKMQWTLVGMLLWAGLACAQAPAAAPSGATGICKDGTYSTAANKSGACTGHKGVQTWYADAPATPAPATPAATPPAASKKLSPAQAAGQKPQAPGGGKGLVWLNTGSNVYHCGDDPYYGRTKAGAYMSEADAQAKGAHGVRGATCAGK